MQITSTAFENSQRIPRKYTCDGDNVNPPLEFRDVPDGTKSLVLIMDDPDIPDFVKQRNAIQVWVHWVVFNMAPTTSAIEEKEDPGMEGNGTGEIHGYQGPCPPDREHRYFFKLYALNDTLDLKEGSTKEQVEKAMEGHVIEKAELIGLYERS